jgi:hypothetical protein
LARQSVYLAGLVNDAQVNQVVHKKNTAASVRLDGHDQQHVAIVE